MIDHYYILFRQKNQGVQTEKLSNAGLPGFREHWADCEYWEITGEEKALRKVIMSVVTDSKGLEEPKDPDTCNVYALYKLVATPEELQEMREKMLAGNYGYGHAKQALFEKLWAYFEPMRKRREELENNLDYVRDLLKTNGEKARNEAAILLDKVRSAVGLR